MNLKNVFMCRAAVIEGNINCSVPCSFCAWELEANLGRKVSEAKLTPNSEQKAKCYPYLAKLFYAYSAARPSHFRDVNGA